MSSYSIFTLSHLQISCYNWEEGRDSIHEYFCSFSVCAFHDSCQQMGCPPHVEQTCKLFCGYFCLSHFSPNSAHSGTLHYTILLQEYLIGYIIMFYITYPQAFCETHCGPFVTLLVLPQQDYLDLKYGLYRTDYGIWSPFYFFLCHSS